MDCNALLELIRTRRSIRQFTKKEISPEKLDAILEAARWAPSGLNNQPWRFVVIKHAREKEKLSKLTHYSSIVTGAYLCIAVYYHLPSGYDRDKDFMGIGACIQNILLAAHSMGLGCVWLGEILNRKNDVSILLNVNSEHELAAVVALGYPDEHPTRERIVKEKLILGRL